MYLDEKAVEHIEHKGTHVQGNLLLKLTMDDIAAIDSPWKEIEDGMNNERTDLRKKVQRSSRIQAIFRNVRIQ